MLPALNHTSGLRADRAIFYLRGDTLSYSPCKTLLFLVRVLDLGEVEKLLGFPQVVPVARSRERALPHADRRRPRPCQAYKPEQMEQNISGFEKALSAPPEIERRRGLTFTGP